MDSMLGIVHYTLAFIVLNALELRISLTSWRLSSYSTRGKTEQWQVNPSYLQAGLLCCMHSICQGVQHKLYIILWCIINFLQNCMLSHRDSSNEIQQDLGDSHVCQRWLCFGNWRKIQSDCPWVEIESIESTPQRVIFQSCHQCVPGNNHTMYLQAEWKIITN